VKIDNVKLNIKGAIFDLDGVIVSTDSLHSQAWKEICIMHGLIYDKQCEDDTRGVSRRESLKKILEINRHFGFDETRIDEICEQKNNVFCKLLENIDETYIHYNVLEVIDMLKEEKILIGVASSSRNARRILESVGLSKRFDVIVSGDEILNSKPNPEAFVKCLRKLSLTGKETIAIEDSLAGLHAAKSAEMTAIYIGSNEVCAQFADYQIYEIGQLREVCIFPGNKEM